MALDPNIILQARGVQLDSPLDTYASVAQVQAARNQNRIADIAFQDRSRAQAADSSLAQLLASGKTGDEIVSGLAGGGFGSQALAYQKTAQEQKKSAAELKKAEADAQETQVKAAKTSFDSIASTLGALQAVPGGANPVMIQRALGHLSDIGVIKPEMVDKVLASAPQDPSQISGWLEQQRNAAMSAKEQVAARQQQQEFGETKRSNIAREGLTTSGQAITIRGQNMVDSRSRDATAVAAENKKNKGLPPTALKMQQSELDALATASSIQADLSAIEKQISSGKLDFGMVSNASNSAINALGMSTESSRNFASFKSTLEKLRNDSLRLNAGVQTDGDAQRAWNELLSNINDKGVVKQRLAEIKKINARAVELRKLNVDQIRTNFNQEPLDTSRYESQPAAVGNGGKAKSAAPALPSGWSVKEN